MAKYILHGTYEQDLKKIGSGKSRFGERIFATYDLQRALRYIAGIENGGDGVLSIGDGKLYVLNTNPEKLVTSKGSIYKLNPEGFKPDLHKGERSWVYSSTDECDVVEEIEFDSVLDAWTAIGIFAVSRELSPRFLEDISYRGGLIHGIVETQRQMVREMNFGSELIIEKRLRDYLQNCSGLENKG